MFKKMNTKQGLLIAALGVVFSGWAQTATITHADNTVETVELKQTAEGVYYYIVEGNHRIYLKQTDTCEGTACPGQANSHKVSSGKFGVYGSNTVGAELMPQLITTYADTLSADVKTIAGAKQEEKNLLVTTSSGKNLFDVDLKSHGSGTAFPALQNGLAEIGMASRNIKAKEEEKLAAVGIREMRSAGKEHVVALDGLVVIVSQDNPINVLSMKEIAQLFSGEITNWSQLGGEDKPVTIYSRDDNSGTYDTFKGLVLKPNGKKLSAAAKRFESNEALSDKVSQDSGAIGFTGFAYIRNAKPLSLASDCGIVSKPSVFDVKTEEYPLSRRLYLYTTGKKISSHASQLLKFSLSDSAQDVISEVGFIDQSVDALTLNEQGQRLANTMLPANFSNTRVELAMLQKMLTELKYAKRLSTTFRFKTGSSELDVKAAQDIRRIASLLSRPDSVFADKDIYLIGFTDSVGNFNNNARLSRNRAVQVYNTLSRFLSKKVRSRVKTLGYGELSPVACNTSNLGKGKNRRVEIWVK